MRFVFGYIVFIGFILTSAVTVHAAPFPVADREFSVEAFRTHLETRADSSRPSDQSSQSKPTSDKKSVRWDPKTRTTSGGSSLVDHTKAKLPKVFVTLTSGGAAMAAGSVGRPANGTTPLGIKLRLSDWFAQTYGKTYFVDIKDESCILKDVDAEFSFEYEFENGNKKLTGSLPRVTRTPDSTPPADSPPGSPLRSAVLSSFNNLQHYDPYSPCGRGHRSDSESRTPSPD